MSDREALAHALLARALIADKKPKDALRAIQQATAISSKSQDPEIRMSVAVIEARVGAAQGNAAVTAKAIRRLGHTVAEADKLGYLDIALEARFALGETEMKSGAKAQGRFHLESVERMAKEKGFNLLSRKAAAARDLKDLD